MLIIPDNRYFLKSNDSTMKIAFFKMINVASKATFFPLLYSVSTPPPQQLYCWQLNFCGPKSSFQWLKTVANPCCRLSWVSRAGVLLRADLPWGGSYLN